MNDTDSIARRLVDAYRQRIRIPALPASGPADIGQAYAVQRAVWRELAGEGRPTAWKVGASALDAEPVAAAVLPSRLAFGPARLPGDLFTGLGIEAEIALRFARNLPARPKPYDHAEILAAVGSAHVAMELVDTRLADAAAAGPLWRLADSLLNGALVLGDAIVDWHGLDGSSRMLRVAVDGQELAHVAGRPPLSDICHCLPWWLAHVGGVRPGDIVTTGAWSGMHPVAAAGRFAVVIEGLGRVEANVGTGRVQT
ncbi:MAG: fumarylacetoacetate hydrolase family protein [Hydrogenophilaceae bacterium]